MLLLIQYKKYHLQQNILHLQRWQILRRKFLVLSRFMLV